MKACIWLHTIVMNSCYNPVHTLILITVDNHKSWWIGKHDCVHYLL